MSLEPPVSANVVNHALPPVWRARLGTYKTTAALLDALALDRIYIDDCAFDLIGRHAFRIAEVESHVNLVALSASELGFPNGGRYIDICIKALELGFAYCPPEAGPQLRLQYRDQPICEWLRVAMKPIVDSRGHRCIFALLHDTRGLGLSWFRGDPDYRWESKRRFIFVCP